MKDIHWKKLSLFKKIIFCLGWVGVLNLAFWIALLIHNSMVQEKKFWNPKSYRIVYVFGWIFLIGVLGLFFIGFFWAIVNNLLAVPSV